MSTRYAIRLARMALLFVLATSPFVPFLAAVYPGHVVPIILLGAVAIAAPLGIVFARSLLRGLEDELVERYRKSEVFYLLAASASQLGVVMASLTRGAVATLGIVMSAAGMLAAMWLLWKVSPAGSRRNRTLPAPHGRLD
jgi:hypothetical protein